MIRPKASRRPQGPRARASTPSALVVRVPAQARSRASLERTLAAVEALLHERLFEEISVADIVRRAGTSVGSFYQRFGGKQALLPYLLERHLEKQLAQSEAQLGDRKAWAGVGLRARVEGLVHGAIFGLRKGRGLYRALFVRGVTRPQEMSRTERARQDRLLDTVVAWLLDCREEIHHPDPETAVRLAMTSAYAIANLHVLFDDVPGRVPIVLDDQRLGEELALQMGRYLGISDPEPAPSQSTKRRRKP